MAIKAGGKSARDESSVDKKLPDSDEFDTLTGKAVAALKNNIIIGVHQPGEKLRVEYLKHQYGVSSSTLREALTTLIADRLVVAEGQRGFRVKPASAEDLIDLNRIRIVLEKEALRQSIAHGDDNWESQVVSSFHFYERAAKALEADRENMSVFDEWERRHRAFHVALFSAAPSEWSRYFLSIAYEQYERYRYMFRDLIKGYRLGRDVHGEHKEILDLVLARDADAAASLLEKHLMKTLDEWVEYFKTRDAFGR